MKIQPSSQSADAAYQKAQDFAYLAGSEGFEKAAENSSYQIQETPEFTKGGTIPGLGFNDVAMNFAFSNSIGDISDAFSVSGGYVVCKVSDIREEGVRPLADVKNIVRSMVLREKRMKEVKEYAEEFYRQIGPSTDLTTVAQSFPNIPVQKTGPFKGNDTPAGVGRDLTFMGIAVSLDEGEISEPFEGSRGYYILKLTTKTPFDTTLYSNLRPSLRDQILQEKQNNFSASWLASLREKAEIEDNRDRFFR